MTVVRVTGVVAYVRIHTREKEEEKRLFSTKTATAARIDFMVCVDGASVERFWYRGT